jgi:MoaE-MoaD fusion protein
MELTVLLFASLREAAGQSQVHVDVKPGDSVGQVLEAVSAQHSALSRERLRTVAVAVNEDYVDRAHVVSEGDEIALIPPVSGGAL